MAIIEVSHLTKEYHHVPAITDLSFSIEKGTLVGFVGKNGAGKSTTIRCLMNFIFPTQGSCHIQNLDTAKSPVDVRKIVGYMPSDTAFYPHVTSKELFAMWHKFSPIDSETVEQLANYFELDMNKKISELSLGNRKKVSIIQMFLKQNEILILDEPTSGLDPLMQEKFFQLLLKEKEKGVTIFLSSHNLVEIERYCDRAIILKDGNIIDDIDMKNTTIKKEQMVTYQTKDGKTTSFTFNEDINDLIKTLSTLDLTHLEIRNTSVEEEFIKYYQAEV